MYTFKISLNLFKNHPKIKEKRTNKSRKRDNDKLNCKLEKNPDT
jgi:hypothetical protein